MKNIEDIKAFYEARLLPELKALEEKRLKTLNKVILAGVFIGIPAAAFSFYMRHAMPLIFGAVIFLVAMKYLSSDYVFDFKSAVIEKIVNFVDSNLKYSKTGYIPRGDFLLSSIFRQYPDRYSGDDLVSGKIGDTAVRFSELHAEYVTRDSKGRTQYHTIFKGLFFIADFNKKFNGLTVVLPDVAERLFGHVGAMLQSCKKGRGELVKLEDPEFERLFVVYGTDQIEARYILSTSLMERIVDFQKKHNRRLYISFIGNKIFMAVSYARDLFEPRLFRTILDFEPIRMYFEDLYLAAGIVEDLNLNLRIWT